MTRIYTDANGVYVNAISSVGDKKVEGHLYYLQAFTDSTVLQFQQGGVAQNGVNGVTNEVLLAVLQHRLRHLDGLFPCEENKTALYGVTTALSALEARTAARVARGVEGKEVA